MASKGFSINDIIDFSDMEKTSQREIHSPAPERAARTEFEELVRENVMLKEAEKKELEAEKDAQKKASARESETDSPKKPFFYLLSQKGEEIPAKILPASIGRSEACTVRIDGRSISRVHALVTMEDGKFYLEDKSTAGSYLAAFDHGRPVIRRLGKELPKKTEITDGQVIQFATEIYTFVIGK